MARAISETWRAVSKIKEEPEETQLLLPVIYKRKSRPKKKIEVAGLKVAEEETAEAKSNAERLVIKAAKKAIGAGIPHDLFKDFEVEGQPALPQTEETVESKLLALQTEQEKARQEVRELDVQKEQLGAKMEEDASRVAEEMEVLLSELASVKVFTEKLGEVAGKLPPDRINEVLAVEEAANSILSKARKTKRKQRRLLKLEDIGHLGNGTWLSVYWPDDNQWWNVLVQTINASEATATLLYETEEAEHVSLKQLIEKGEIAWLEIPIFGESNTKRRKKHHPTP